MTLLLKGAKEAVIRNLKNLASACTLPYQGKNSQKAKKGTIANILRQSGLHRDCLYLSYNCDALPSVSKS